MEEPIRDFLGAGWKFPVRVNSAGKIVLSRHEEDIREAIWIILSTAKGERVMRPDFGCGIHDLVFALNSPGTAGRASNEVRQALIRWEPRIDVLSVDVYPGAAQPNLLLIEINYQVRATSNSFNLVYPFYLE